jgi:NAD(P)-dependent dehydrogenase (short-subunit alcohol dehydrogenase family)
MYLFMPPLNQQGRALESVSDSEKAAATGSGLSAFGEKHPLGRVGGPEEVAAAIVFLASPRASFITGVVFYVPPGSRLALALVESTCEQTY